MKALTLRLPDDVYEALHEEALKKRRSVNSLILEALRVDRYVPAARGATPFREVTD